MWEATKQAIRHLRSYERTNRLLYEKTFDLDCGKLESGRRKRSTARHQGFYTSSTRSRPIEPQRLSAMSMKVSFERRKIHLRFRGTTVINNALAAYVQPTLWHQGMVAQGDVTIVAGHTDYSKARRTWPLVSALWPPAATHY